MSLCLSCVPAHGVCIFFFFNDTATTEIYTLSLHDALPISSWAARRWRARADHPAASSLRTRATARGGVLDGRTARDRKSTRLNSSHSQISYAVFCLKKKKNKHKPKTVDPIRSKL